MLPFGLPFGKQLVVPDEHIHRADAHHRGELFVPSLHRVVVDDVVRDLFQPSRRFHQLPGVDPFDFDVHFRLGAGLAFVPADILDSELQHVLVFDRVGDHIAVQLLVEQILRRLLLPGLGCRVVGKDRRAGEAEQLVVAEKLRDALVRVAELAAVTLVENENDPLIPQLVHLGQILRPADGGVQLLQSRHDQLRVVGELLDELLCVVRAVDAAFAEAVELFDCLVIQILPVHAEDHFIDVGQAGNDLRRFEGCQRLAAARRVPDVAVRVLSRRTLYTLDDPFGGVVLVGPQHHQDLVRLVEHDVLADHRPHVRPVQEGRGKGRQFADGLVVLSRPVKGLLKGLPPSVGVILRVDAVRNHEELHEVKESVAAPEGVFLVTLDLVEGLLHLQTAPLQLDLHQRQAVDQDRHVVAIFVAALDGHLLRHLVAIPQRIR